MFLKSISNGVFAALCTISTSFFASEVRAQYVFDNGSIWGVGAGFIIDSDPSSFQQLRYRGTSREEMYDRRVQSWITTNAFVFVASFADGRDIEFHVHADFASPEAAQQEAFRYTHALGQMPEILRRRVRTFSILPGNALYGGGNDNVHVSSERTNEYLREGNLAEVLFHEAAHASLDPRYGQSRAWRQAQNADAEWISKYAFDFPAREDMAEMAPVAYAMIFHPDRVPRQMRERIERTMPNRMAFFRNLYAQ